MLTIHDEEVFWDGPTKKVVQGYPMNIRVKYLSAPILRQDGLYFNEDQAEYALFPVDPKTGLHDTLLLWPTERRGDNSAVQVRRVAGSVYQGVVPQGVTGPVTFQQLIDLYGWQIVSPAFEAGQVEVGVVGPTGAQGPPGVQGPQGPAGTTGSDLPQSILVTQTLTTAALSDPTAIVYTVPANSNKVISALSFSSLNAASVLVVLSITRTDGTFQVLGPITIPAISSRSIKKMCTGLEDGDVIRAAATGANITLTISGGEMEDTTVRVVRLMLGGALPTSGGAVTRTALETWFWGEILLNNSATSYNTASVTLLRSVLAGPSVPLLVEPILPASFSPLSLKPDSNGVLTTGDYFYMAASNSGITATVTVLVHSATPTAPATVPTEYAVVSASLAASITSMQSTFAAIPARAGSPFPISLGADLLQVNGNNGPYLWGGNPRTIGDSTWNAAVALAKEWVDASKKMGMKCLTLAMEYPLLLPTYNSGTQTNADYAKYVAYYDAIVAYIKSVGIKVIMEIGPVFAATGFSVVTVNYTGMTLTQLNNEFKTMIQFCVTRWQPWEIQFLTETDTMVYLFAVSGANTGTATDPVDALNSNAGAVNWINTILSGFTKGSTLMGAGQATWQPSSRTQQIVASCPGLDMIDLHVYPINLLIAGGDTNVAGVIANSIGYAKAGNKRLSMTEVYGNILDYLRENLSSSGGFASNNDIFNRNGWLWTAALQEQFHQAIVDLARAQNIEVISSFFAHRHIFAGGMEAYTAQTSQDTYDERVARLNAAISTSMPAYLTASGSAADAYLTPFGIWFRNLLATL